MRHSLRRWPQVPFHFPAYRSQRDSRASDQGICEMWILSDQTETKPVWILSLIPCDTHGPRTTSVDPEVKGTTLMRVIVDSKRDAHETLRAVELWVSDLSVCADANRDEVLRLLEGARIALDTYTRDQRTR